MSSLKGHAPPIKPASGTAPVNDNRSISARAPFAAPLKVLIAAPQPFYQERGTPIAVLNVLEALTRLGAEIDLLTFAGGQDIELSSVRILRVGRPRPENPISVGFSLRKLRLDIVLTNKLRRCLRPGAYDAVHAVEEAIFPTLWFGPRVGIPVIYDMQSGLPDQMMKHAFFRPHVIQNALKLCERWALHHSSLVACSAGLGDHVRAVCSEARVEEWLYPASFPNSALDEIARVKSDLDIVADAPVVFYGGTFESYQGLDLLLDSVPHVLERFPSAVFVLVGKPAELDLSVRTLRAVPNHAIKIIGRLPRPEALSLMAAADVVVSPRISGLNLPLKIGDYMAAGKTIVATDVPSHRPLLDHKVAILVPPTAQGLAGGIIEALSNPTVGTKLGAAARAVALNRLTKDRFTNQVARIYATVTGRDVFSGQAANNA